ncbi:MAG: recombinase family protein [Verrucomicrobiota bacterium]
MKSNPSRSDREGYGYGRYSSKGQEDGDTIRRQTESIKSLSVKYHIKVLKVFFDEATSGKAGLNLERQFGELLKVIKPGQVLLCDSQERLGRQDAFVLGKLISDIVDKGVEIIFEDGLKVNQDNYKTLAIQFAIFTKGALGHYEIVERGRKIHQAWVGKMEKVFTDNKPFKHCGPCWITYDDKTELYSYDQDKVDTIKDIFNLASNKMGIMKIVQRLNQDKTKPISNGSDHWTFNGVHGLLRNKACIGVYISSDGREIEGHYKPIVDETLFFSVQKSLHDRKKGKGGGRPSKFHNIYKGLVRCSCGSSLVLTHRTFKEQQKEYTYLVCNRKRLGLCKPYESIPFDTFDSSFRSLFLSDPKTILSTFKETKQDYRSKAIEGELSTIETRLAKYQQDIEDGKIDLSNTVSTVIMNLEKKQKTLKADLELERTKESQANELPNLLKGYFKTTAGMFYVNQVPKVKWTNDMLKTFVDQISISGNTFKVVLKDSNKTALSYTILSNKTVI